MDAINISRCSMAAHMEFDTEIPDELCARIIGVFTHYWRRNININELRRGLWTVGYHRDLADDGLYQFLNPEDIQ